MHFPAERCTFLQKNAAFFGGGGTGQETAGNCRRVSGFKNQERYPTFTRFFDVHVFVLKSDSLTKNIFHVCVFVPVARQIDAESVSYVHLIQNRWYSEVFTHVHVYWIRKSCPKTIGSGSGKPNQRKASSWTFPGDIPEQKFNVNRACFPEEKHQNSQKWAKFMNFSFGPFFGLVCRGDSRNKRMRMYLFLLGW